MHLELAARERLAQIELELAAQPRLGVVFGHEEAEGAAALGLRRIHREIGALEQFVEIVAVIGRDRDADAGIGRDLLALAVLRACAALRGCFRASAVSSAWSLVAGLDDGEFVAAEPRDEVVAADAGAQAVGDLASSSSPTSWPSESLTPLNSSTSM